MLKNNIFVKKAKNYHFSFTFDVAFATVSALLNKPLLPTVKLIDTHAKINRTITVTTSTIRVITFIFFLICFFTSYPPLY